MPPDAGGQCRIEARCLKQDALQAGPRLCRDWLIGLRPRGFERAGCGNGPVIQPGPLQQFFQHIARRQRIGGHKPRRHAGDRRPHEIGRHALVGNEPVDQRGFAVPLDLYAVQRHRRDAPPPVVGLDPGNRIIHQRGQMDRADPGLLAGVFIAERIGKQLGRDGNGPFRESIRVNRADPEIAATGFCRDARDQIARHVNLSVARFDQRFCIKAGPLPDQRIIAGQDMPLQPRAEPVMACPLQPQHALRAAAQVFHFLSVEVGEIARVVFQHCNRVIVATDHDQSAKAQHRGHDPQDGEDKHQNPPDQEPAEPVPDPPFGYQRGKIERAQRVEVRFIGQMARVHLADAVEPFETSHCKAPPQYAPTC